MLARFLDFAYLCHIQILKDMRRLTYWMMALSAAFIIAACQQQGRNNAQGHTPKDSDEYYLRLSARGVAFYQAYNVDSFVDCNERIHQYLLRHEERKDKEIQILRAHWLKARGVYFAALASRPDSGIIYTEKAIQLMEREGMDPELRVITMLNKADFYRQTGQLDLSADGYLSALAVADSFNTSEDSRIAISLGIGTTYTFMGDYVNSVKWWGRCEQMLPQMSKPDQFIYYNNRGNDYYLQDQYAEALPLFEQAASLVKDDKDKTWDYYTARLNIAEILINLKEGDKAKPILEEADSFFQKVNFGILLYYANTSKIELAMLEGKTNEAIRIIQQDKTPENMIPAAVVMRLNAVEHAWRQAGNYANAYRAHQERHALNDSIQTANVKMQMSTRLMEYEHDKRLTAQQRQIERGKMISRLAWALFFVAMMAAFLLIVLYLLHRRKERMQALELRQKLIETRLRNTRNRLSPHFIYNALTHEMLAQMDGKAVNFNTLTQLLRRGLAIADHLETSLQDELSFVSYYATIEGQQLGDDFRYEEQIAEGIDTAKVFLPALTIQIFAENAIKHGLRPVKPRQDRYRRLTVQVSRKGNATLVEVIDNGNGLKDEGRITEQTGMRVVRQTIQMLNDQNSTPIQFGIGNWHGHDGDGCRSWILLPDGYNYTIR